MLLAILLISCQPPADNNNNTNNTNDNNGSNDSSLVPTANLTLQPTLAGLAWVKISGNTVYINATGLAGAITPHSNTDPNNRGFDDVAAHGGAAPARIFNIKYPDATAAAVLYFVNRASVSTNDITMPATSATACSSSESDDDARATAGNGTCREYTAGGDEIVFRNYLGTVFNNTDTANRARGIMRCSTGIEHNSTTTGGRITITDTIIFDRYPHTSCYIAVVNSAGTASTAMIDDAWVGDTASTTEVEFYAIGIDVTGKTIPQFSSETGYGLTRFTTDHDNAAFKKLLRNNSWGELKFKVRIVTAAEFAALP